MAARTQVADRQPSLNITTCARDYAQAMQKATGLKASSPARYSCEPGAAAVTAQPYIPGATPVRRDTNRTWTAVTACIVPARGLSLFLSKPSTGPNLYRMPYPFCPPCQSSPRNPACRLPSSIIYRSGQEPDRKELMRSSSSRKQSSSLQSALLPLVFSLSLITMISLIGTDAAAQTYRRHRYSSQTSTSSSSGSTSGSSQGQRQGRPLVRRLVPRLVRPRVRRPEASRRAFPASISAM